MNICIFGDSLTWGAWLKERVAWADLLRNSLEKEFVQKYSVYNLGIDGNTSRDLLNRFDVEANARKPAIIIIAIGVNDSCYLKSVEQPLVEIEQFEKNLNALLVKAQNYTSQVILVGLVKGDDTLTIPFPGSTTGKCYEKSRVQAYDWVVSQLAKQKNLCFVQLSDKLDDQDFIDGLHLNASGHKKIFQAVRQSINPYL